jgi:hypothetical protein
MNHYQKNKYYFVGKKDKDQQAMCCIGRHGRNKRHRETESDIKVTVGGVSKMAARRTDCFEKWRGETTQ